MRSGHHAVMHGILHHLPPLRVQVNNCQKNGRFHWFEVEGERREKKTLGDELTRSNSVVVNFEHSDLTGYDRWMRGWRDLEEEFNMVVLRDPYNWLASSLKKDIFKNKIPLKMSLWKQQAREVLRETSLLPNMIPILYNNWVRDIDYRRSVLSGMDLDYDPSYDSSSFRGLSSFGDSKSYLERWVHYKDNESFLSRIDEETKELSERIFRFRPF